MPPKKPSHLLLHPPSASPSQDHEEYDVLQEPQPQESQQEPSETEEQNQITQKTPQKLSRTSKNQPRYESSEEEVEGSETDDGDHTTKNSPTPSSFMIKPIANKNNNSIETGKPTTKRALIDADGRKDLSKKTKVSKDHHIEEDREVTIKKVGSPFRRVFNPADEISILGGMIDYQKQKGADPHADMGAFLEFVKGRFGFEVTKNQLYEKVRRLKNKFFANLKKGERFIPAKPHDIECFELSKNIWGGNDRVVGYGVDHTENDNVKIVDGVWITKTTGKGRSSGGKHEEKGENKKKESDKNNNNNKKMDGPKTVVEETQTVTKEDVMKEKEESDKNSNKIKKKKKKKKKKKMKMDDGPKIVEEEAEIVTKEEVMKEKEDVGKDYEKFVKNGENVVKDNEQKVPLKYPNLVASLSMDMQESQRKLMLEGLCLIDSEKARELEGCWKALHLKETEFYSRKLELMAEQSRLVIDALNKRR